MSKTFEVTIELPEAVYRGVRRSAAARRRQGLGSAHPDVTTWLVELVDAALPDPDLELAKAMREAAGPGPDAWDDLAPFLRERYLRQARAAREFLAGEAS